MLMTVLLLLAGQPVISQFTGDTARLYKSDGTPLGPVSIKELLNNRKEVPLAASDNGCGRPQIDYRGEVHTVRNLDVITRDRKTCGCQQLPSSPAGNTGMQAGRSVAPGGSVGVSGGLASGASACVPN